MIKRIQFDQLKENIAQNKVVLLTGPRRAGKRFAVNYVLNELGKKWIQLDASTRSCRKQFESISAEMVSAAFDGHQFVVIHEAQYLDKLQELIELLLTDESDTTLILCCSYQPLMDAVLREVLQLQGLEMTIHPTTFYELAQHNSLPTEEQLLEQRLIYGNYPEVTENLDQAQDVLSEMVQEVIFTNLGVTDRINKGENLMRMLQTIAFHIGEPISYNEIAEKSDLDNETVERYIDLLEKSYLLIRLPSFFNDKRYELKKSHVIYFVDNGIRNVLIRNFNPLNLRNDVDQLWRNWLISERIKWNKLQGKNAEYKFWRTHTKQTMDFLEFQNGQVAAYKTAWEKKKKIKFPTSFTEAYPTISTHSLNRSTYWSFLTKK